MYIHVVMIWYVTIVAMHCVSEHSMDIVYICTVGQTIGNTCMQWSALVQYKERYIGMQT